MKPSGASAATPATGVPVRTPASRAAAAVELVKSRKLSTAAMSAAGFGSIDEVIDIVAKQFRLPRLELDTVTLDPELANLVPRPLAERHRIVPVFASAQELSLA